MYFVYFTSFSCFHQGVDTAIGEGKSSRTQSCHFTRHGSPLLLNKQSSYYVDLDRSRTAAGTSPPQNVLEIARQEKSLSEINKTLHPKTKK
jgi:hypothetical protein